MGQWGARSPRLVEMVATRCEPSLMQRTQLPFVARSRRAAGHRTLPHDDGDNKLCKDDDNDTATTVTTSQSRSGDDNDDDNENAAAL